MESEENAIKNESLDVSGRRAVIGWFWKMIGALAFLELGWITHSVLRSPKKTLEGDDPKLVDVGLIDEFAPGTVTPIPQGQFHLACLPDGSFLALSKTCTHLGCSVPWDAEKTKFVCPCHGSTFDLQGRVLTSPAIRPLDYFPVLIENGLVRVDISKPLQRDYFDPAQTSRV